jgi:hypothetical protein
MDASPFLALVERTAKLLLPPETHEKIKVQAIPSEGTGLSIELSVPEEERGKIFGKQGRTAEAIRTLVNAAATKHKTRVSFRIAE